MIELKISGNSFTEINAQLMDVVRGIGGGPSVKNDEPVQPVMSNDVAAPAHAVETPKRKRRTPEEMEADKAAKLASAQAEVKAAHVAPAPITIPSMPTTHHAVSLPKETVEPVQQSFTPPTPAPIQQPPNAYNIHTFKQNLIMIVNNLLSSGKLTSQWIADTSAAAFGGAELWMWAQNETKIKELFDNFVEWQFIQKFEA
jgi:hypothetical protein